MGAESSGRKKKSLLERFKTGFTAAHTHKHAIPYWIHSFMPLLILLTFSFKFHSLSPTMFLTSSSPYCLHLSRTHAATSHFFSNISLFLALLPLLCSTFLSPSHVFASPLIPPPSSSLLRGGERLRCHSQ